MRQQLEMNPQFEISRDISNDTKAVKEAMERGNKAEASKPAFIPLAIISDLALNSPRKPYRPY